MSKHGSADVGFLLTDGYNLLASEVFDLNGPETEALTEESDGLGKAWQEHTATGLKRSTLSHSGLYDDAASAIVDVMVGQQQTVRILAVNLDGNTLGRGAVGLAGAMGTTVTRTTARGALHKLSVNYTVTGARDEGVILDPLGAHTANWTNASVDNGAATTNGGAGILQVTAFSGFTGVVVKIQHSSDNSIWADLITFTNVTTAPTAQRITVAGTVNRYLRAVGTVTGSGSITTMVSFARG